MSETNEASVQSVVVRLESRIVQVQVVSKPSEVVTGSLRVGSHTQVYALCEDGTLWLKYVCVGDCNVPAHGGWERL
jgi:hypothetical protein